MPDPLTAAPVIVLFRDDLRLADHPALFAASRTNAPVVPLYVVDKECGLGVGSNARPLGGAARWWLHDSLLSLDKSLRQIGSRLIVRARAPARHCAEACRGNWRDAGAVQ